MTITQATSVLSAKEQALVGVALSIASGCKPCTERYVRAAEAAGACNRGIRLAIESALAAREQATSEIATLAESLQGGKPELDAAFVAPRAMWQAIYATGAAFAQRATLAVEGNAAKAIALGATKAQLIAAFAQARAILSTSGEHTEGKVAELELSSKTASPATGGCACGSC
ncbi:MAG TPA: carboxymuconolactone decarboxylase family protein, partial [Polyangiaceae bacterium]